MKEEPKGERSENEAAVFIKRSLGSITVIKDLSV